MTDALTTEDRLDILAEQIEHLTQSVGELRLALSAMQQQERPMRGQLVVDGVPYDITASAVAWADDGA